MIEIDIEIYQGLENKIQYQIFFWKSNLDQVHIAYQPVNSNGNLSWSSY